MEKLPPSNIVSFDISVTTGAMLAVVVKVILEGVVALLETSSTDAISA